MAFSKCSVRSAVPQAPQHREVIPRRHEGNSQVYDGSTSAPFDIRSGVKQGCILAPTLFEIFFAVLLRHAFGSVTEGIYLHTRSDGKLFNISRLKAKTKVHEVHEVQRLRSHHQSEKKPNIMGQGVVEPPSISVNDQELEVVHEFIYLGSTDNLSLDSELSRRIGKAATTLSRLTKRVWNNTKLTEHTKVQVYKACVLSTLRYSSET